jgi:hypothetical protein
MQNRLNQVVFCFLSGFGYGLRLWQEGRDRRGEGATCAVRVARRDAMTGQLDHLIAIVKDVDGVIARKMAALDEHPAVSGVRHQITQTFGNATHLAYGLDTAHFQ